MRDEPVEKLKVYQAFLHRKDEGNLYQSHKQFEMGC